MEINGGNTFVWLQGNGTASKIMYSIKQGSGSWGVAALVD